QEGGGGADGLDPPARLTAAGVDDARGGARLAGGRGRAAGPPPRARRGVRAQAGRGLRSHSLSPARGEGAHALPLPRHHFDVAVLPAFDGEFARVDLPLVAGDDDVFTLGQDEGGEGADLLADDVAARGQHAEGRAGEGLAARGADELQRYRGGAVIERGVREL